MNECWQCEKLKNELYCVEKIRADFLKLKHVLFAQDDTIRLRESQVQKDLALQNQVEAVTKELVQVKSERLRLQVQSEKQAELIVQLEKHVVQLKNDCHSAEKELQTVQAKLDALQDKNGSGTPAVKRPTRATRGAKKASSMSEEENAELLDLIESELAAVGESTPQATSQGSPIDTGEIETEKEDVSSSHHTFLPDCSDLDTSEDEIEKGKTAAPASSSSTSRQQPEANPIQNTNDIIPRDIQESAEAVQSKCSTFQEPSTQGSDILSDISEAIYLCSSSSSSSSSKAKDSILLQDSHQSNPITVSSAKVAIMPQEQPKTHQKNQQKVSVIEKKSQIVLDEDAGKDTSVQLKQRKAHASNLPVHGQNKIAKNLGSEGKTVDTVPVTSQVAGYSTKKPNASDEKIHKAVLGDAEKQKSETNVSRHGSLSDSSSGDGGSENENGTVSVGKRVCRKRKDHSTGKRFMQEVEDASVSTDEKGEIQASMSETRENFTETVSSVPDTAQPGLDILNDISEALSIGMPSNANEKQKPVKSSPLAPCAQASNSKSSTTPEEQPKTQKKPKKLSSLEKNSKIVLDEDAGKDSQVQTKQRRAHAPNLIAPNPNENAQNLISEESRNEIGSKSNVSATNVNDPVPEPMTCSEAVDADNSGSRGTEVLKNKPGLGGFRRENLSDSSDNDIESGSELLSQGRKRIRRSMINISRQVFDDSDDDNSSENFQSGAKTATSVPCDAKEANLGLQDNLSSVSTKCNNVSPPSKDPIVPLPALRDTPNTPAVTDSQNFALNVPNIDSVSATSTAVAEPQIPNIANDIALNSSEFANTDNALPNVPPELENAPVNDVLRVLLGNKQVDAVEKETGIDHTELIEISNISCELDASLSDTLKDQDLSIHESDIDVSPTKLAQTFFNESFEALNRDLINCESEEDDANDESIPYQRKDSVQIVEKLFQDMYQKDVGKLWFETSFELFDMNESDFELPDVGPKTKDVSLAVSSSYSIDNRRIFENDDVFEGSLQYDETQVHRTEMPQEMGIEIATEPDTGQSTSNLEKVVPTILPSIPEDNQVQEGADVAVIRATTESVEIFESGANFETNNVMRAVQEATIYEKSEKLHERELICNVEESGKSEKDHLQNLEAVPPQSIMSCDSASCSTSSNSVTHSFPLSFTTTTLETVAYENASNSSILVVSSPGQNEPPLGEHFDSVIIEALASDASHIDSVTLNRNAANQSAGMESIPDIEISEQNSEINCRSQAHSEENVKVLPSSVVVNKETIDDEDTAEAPKTPEPKTLVPKNRSSTPNKPKLEEKTVAITRRSPRIQKKTIQYLMEGFSVKLSDDLPESPEKQLKGAGVVPETEIRKVTRSRRQKETSLNTTAPVQTTKSLKRTRVQKTSPTRSKKSVGRAKIAATTTDTQPEKPLRRVATTRSKAQKGAIIDSDTSSQVEEIISSESVVEISIVEEDEQRSVSANSQVLPELTQTSQKAFENENTSQVTAKGIDSNEAAEEKSFSEIALQPEESLGTSELSVDVCKMSVKNTANASFGRSIEDVGLLSDHCSDKTTSPLHLIGNKSNVNTDDSQNTCPVIQNLGEDRNVLTSTDGYEVTTLQCPTTQTVTEVPRVIQEDTGSDVDSDEGGLCIDLGEENEATSGISPKSKDSKVASKLGHETVDNLTCDQNTKVGQSPPKTGNSEVLTSPQEKVSIDPVLPETESAAHHPQNEVPELLFCGDVDQSQIPEQSRSETAVPELVFCGDINERREQRDVTNDRSGNMESSTATDTYEHTNVDEAGDKITLSDPTVLSQNGTDDATASLEEEEVITCGEVAVDEISKYFADLNSLASQGHLKVPTKTIGGRKIRITHSSDDDPDFHPVITSTNAARAQRQENGDKQSEVFRPKLNDTRGKELSKSSMSKISKKVIREQVNLVKSMVKAKDFKNFREGEDLFDSGEEIDIKAEAEDDYEYEDLGPNSSQNRVNWKSTSFSKSKTKRGFEDEGPPAKQVKRSPGSTLWELPGVSPKGSKRQTATKSTSWNMTMKEESSDELKSSSQQSPRSSKRKDPVPFADKSTAGKTETEDVLKYVKRLICDLKPAEDCARKDFYVKELTQLFLEQKLNANLLVGSLFYVFTFRAFKEELQRGKIGIVAELLMDLQHNVGAELKDVWKELIKKTASFMLPGKIKPKNVLMFIVCFMSKLIASSDSPDATQNEEERRSVREEYLSGVRIFIYDVIVCCPRGWSEVVGLALQHIHQLYRRYSAENGDAMSHDQIAHNVFMTSIDCVICKKIQQNPDLIQKETASSALSTVTCDQSCIQKARQISSQYLFNFEFISQTSSNDLFVCLKAAALLLRNASDEEVNLFLKEFVFKYLRLFSSSCQILFLPSGSEETFLRKETRKNLLFVSEDDALKYADVAVQILAEVSLRPEKPKHALLFFNASKALRIVLECLDTTHKKLQSPLLLDPKKERLEKFQESCCYALMKMNLIDKDAVTAVLRKEENVKAISRNSDKNCFEIKKHSHLFLGHQV